MRKAIIIQLMAQKKRLVGIGLAIMIGIGFLAITMLTGRVIDQGFRNSVGAEYRNIDFVVEATDTSLDTGLESRVEAIDGVADAQPGVALWVDASSHGQNLGLASTVLPDPGALQDALELTLGRFPVGSGEVMVSESAALEYRASEGDQINLRVPVNGSADGETVEETFTIVGIWSGEGRFGGEEYEAFLVPEDIARWQDQSWLQSLFVTVEPGADLARVQEAIAPLAGSTATVVTGDERIDTELEEFADAMTVQKLGINAFAALALVVAGIVVSNTFAILVAQRTREISLFRCAGATAGQVRQMVLTEAAILGIMASAIGVAIAAVLANVALWIVDAQLDYSSIPSSIGVSPGEIIFPMIAGAVLAFVAAWAPAQAATRIDPLLALRVAQSPVGAGHRPGPVRVGISLLLIAGGAILLLGGAAMSFSGSQEFGVVIGMGGGLVTFLGVFVGASVLVPATASLFGKLASRIGGVPAQVAASNSVRNPRRTTSATIALVIGVALVTMMSVGAESLKATLLNEVDGNAPWDLDVHPSGDGSDPAAFADLVQSASRLDGVAASARMRGLDAEIQGTGEQETVAFTASIVDPDALASIWRDPRSIDGFGPGTALVPDWLSDMTGIEDGETFTIAFGSADVELEALVTSSFENLVMAEQDVANLSVSPTLDSLWIRLADDTDRDDVKHDLYDLADERGISISVGGMGGYRETLTSALDQMVFVITALLGVAVLIAIIGVGNTLSLSVIERTRESALLRALGFTKTQLRQSLAVEAVLLSLIGCLIGIVLGVAFGWIGAITVIGDTWPIALGFPLARIGLIVAVAVICGLLASILPARRAAQADPIVALAEV